MKSIKFLLLLAVLLSVFTACKKDDDVVSPGITGRWEGKWGFGNDVPEYDETWIIDEDGTVEVLDDDGDHYAEGTWDLDGDNFVMTYLSTAYNEYSFIGTYNEAALTLEGTWGGTPSSTDGGHFDMSKKN
jgi:hypothetical protein